MGIQDVAGDASCLFVDFVGILVRIITILLKNKQNKDNKRNSRNNNR
jgi:hypothetical protein